MTLEEARERIDQIVGRYRERVEADESLLPGTLTAGKVYEAWVLCRVLHRLHGRLGRERARGPCDWLLSGGALSCRSTNR
jgi:hypothetical protein